MVRTCKALFLLAALLLGLAGFQAPAPTQNPPKPTPTPAPTPAPKPAPKPEVPLERLAGDAPIRLGAILGADKQKTTEQYESVARWLTQELGRPVEFVAVNDRASAVSGLASNKIDLVWLDGLTAAQAESAVEATARGRCWPLFGREEDLKLASFLVAKKALVDAGTFQAVGERKPMAVEKLAELKPKLAGLTITFDAPLSISGHLMPRYFLERPEVGIDPEKHFKKPPEYATEGDPTGVLTKVGSGIFDLGVVSRSAWERATDEQKARAPVIFVTPEYMDSCMVVHGRTGPALSLRLLQAFVSLDAKVEANKAILDGFGAKRFIQAMPTGLAGVREVLKSAKARGVLKP